jgi:nucleoside-diphosphate-sugar epimerase
MVIGNGLLATRFKSYQDDDRFLIFASGVSNSKTKNADAYAREIRLLQESIRQHPGKIMVYFSTCSIYDPDEQQSAYVLHKLYIESIIRQTTAAAFIFRVSNVVGSSGNPNTLLNYFFYHIRNGINFDLWTNACRNIIDIDDLFLVVDELLKHSVPSTSPLNIASPVDYPVREIVNAIEIFLGARSNYVEVNKGSCFKIDIAAIQPLLERLSLRFDNEYLSNLLVKYFSK